MVLNVRIPSSAASEKLCHQWIFLLTSLVARQWTCEKWGSNRKRYRGHTWLVCTLFLPKAKPAADQDPPGFHRIFIKFQWDSQPRKNLDFNLHIEFETMEEEWTKSFGKRTPQTPHSILNVILITHPPSSYSTSSTPNTLLYPIPSQISAPTPSKTILVELIPCKHEIARHTLLGWNA